MPEFNPDPSPNALSDDAFFEMAIRYLDGTLPDEGVACLHAAMAADHARAESFVDTCLIGKLFSESLGLDLRSEGLLADVKDAFSLSDSPYPVADVGHSSSQPAILPAPGVFGHTFHATINYLPSGWLMAYLVATVMTAVGLLVCSHTYVSRPDQVTSLSPLDTKQTAIPGQTAENPVVGRITGMAGCRWSNPQTAPTQNTQVPLGQKYAMASGLLEITYDTGAKVLLQGPVTYEVKSQNGGFLATGRMTGWVGAKSARGFAVQTPTAVVTDLGTEFGVDVDRDGRTVSHVFRGSVQMQIAPAIGSKNGVATSEIMLLREKESACVEIKKAPRGGDARPVLHSVVANPRIFTRLLPSEVDNYVDLVQSLKPVAYYRMERPVDAKNGNVVTDCVGGHHGVLHVESGSSNPWQKGIIGDALAFDGTTYVDVPTLPASENDAVSVAAWVFVSNRSNWANIASEQYATAWDGPRRMQFAFGLLAGDGDLWAGVNARDGRWCHIREGWQSPLLLDYWTHVAFVADGKALRLYRSGAQVASLPCDGVCHTPPIKHLMIGCKNWAQSIDSPNVKAMQFWQGRIDELAIFNHALSPLEIRQLCRSGQREVRGAVANKEK